MDKINRRTDRNTIVANKVNTPVKASMKLLRFRTGQNFGMLWITFKYKYQMYKK